METTSQPAAQTRRTSSSISSPVISAVLAVQQRTTFGSSSRTASDIRFANTEKLRSGERLALRKRVYSAIPQRAFHVVMKPIWRGDPERILRDSLRDGL